MTLETQIADLQASVTALISAINVKKADLDQAVAIAQGIPTITNSVELQNAVNSASASATTAQQARDQALGVSALYPAVAGNGSKIPRVNAGATAMEYRTAAQFKTDLALDSASAVSFGALGLGVQVIKTADFTLGATENYVSNNKSGSACVVTLPAASALNGRIINFVNGANGQPLTSAGANVVPLSGAAAQTTILPAGTGHWATLVSNGTNWVIVQSGAGMGYIQVSDIAPASVRLLSEGLATPTDTELATAAWAAGYADSKVTNLLVTNLHVEAVKTVADGLAPVSDTDLATSAWAKAYADSIAATERDAAIASANATTTTAIAAAIDNLTIDNLDPATVRVVADGFTGLADTDLVTSAWVEAYVKTNPWSYTSAEQTITASSTATLAHGLPAHPTEVKVTLVCTTAQAPYAVGDEVEPLTGMTFSWNATNIYIRTGSSVTVHGATGGSTTLTLASWRYKARAR